MRSPLLLTAGVVAIFVASFAAKARLDNAAGAATVVAPSQAQRIVAMSPSTAETLFALGLGDRVVGVSAFCSYPPEAAEKPKVGDYFDPNYEAILELQPDLVVMLEEAGEPTTAFDRLGLPTLRLNHLIPNHRGRLPVRFDDRFRVGAPLARQPPQTRSHG